MAVVVTLLLVGTVWLAFALACSLVLWFQTSRKISDTDRWCTWTDHALQREYGSGPRWIR